MELIYIQTRLKGEGSPELALEIRKIENLQFFKQLVQTHTIVFMNVLGLDRNLLEIMTESYKSSKPTCSEIFGVL